MPEPVICWHNICCSHSLLMVLQCKFLQLIWTMDSSLPPRHNYWSFFNIQGSPLVRLKGGESYKEEIIFALSITGINKTDTAAKDAVSEDPTNCKLLRCIDLKYLSLLIFRSVLDCWQVYRIMGLIGCLCFTGCNWNLWLCCLWCEKESSAIRPLLGDQREKPRGGSKWIDKQEDGALLLFPVVLGTLQTCALLLQTLGPILGLVLSSMNAAQHAVNNEMLPKKRAAHTHTWKNESHVAEANHIA